ncbi:MAG TPA: alanine--tRNA ligase [Thermoplasmatales archaeon]|nr:alanine--tRNA ligase [Thermoplasmatales archaeon]
MQTIHLFSSDKDTIYKPWLYFYRDMKELNLKKELDLNFFKEKGFIRRKCKSCGSYFWTLDRDSNLCGDQPCVDFSFIGKPPTKRSFSISEMREAFLSFFEKRGHIRIKPYPVVARWRKDIYLTIASIADFQPHVTSGIASPPANPLVVSQPSIRLNDLEEVGVSGKHLTIFEMMGHHAFNSKENFVYWTEETVSYCHEFLCKELGIDESEITYKESIWEGGGNAGPCLEVLVDGLEVATLVFMNLREDENGDFLVNEKKYSEMPLKVVDTGYGLERLTWISHGSKAIYDVLYPEIIKWLFDNSRNMDKHAIYALADHTKCIAFMLGDGIVPSNVRAGYLARLMIRRCLRFMKRLEIDAPLYDIVEMHIAYLKGDFPHLEKSKSRIKEILSIETEKYEETLARGVRLIERFLDENKTLDRDTLIYLYDAHGIHPEMVKRIAGEKGIDVEVPKDFDSLVAELHSREVKEEKKKEIKLPNLPPTRLLYYEDAYLRRFKANVIWSGKTENDFLLVLDKTAFYPEGGGQPSDQGIIIVDGKEVNVKYVEKQGDVVIHHVDYSIEKGKTVEGTIDWSRRYSLMKHHTGTHIINSACRHVLGEHVWQAGSQLDVSEARFDFSHYKPLSEKEIREIERVANDFVRKGIEVNKEVLDRSVAEQRYGIRLYQGGVPESRFIRVINIPGVDVEACGGTHLDNTSEVERIKIVKSERIQDGVNRLVFVAGLENVEKLENEEKHRFDRIVSKLAERFNIENIEKDAGRALQEISLLFSVPVSKIEATVEKFMKDISEREILARDVKDACEKLFKMWKKKQKEKKRIPRELIEELLEFKERFGDYDIIIIEDEKMLKGFDSMAVAEEMVKSNAKTVVCINDSKGIVFAASSDVEIDLRPIAKEVGLLLGGGGGGKQNIARCGGSNLNKLKEALERAKELIGESLKV